MRCGSLLFAVGLLVGDTACGHRQVEEAQPEAKPVRVEVKNNYALAMEIYITGAGSTQRLGVVHPGMGGLFTVPRTLIGGTGSVEFSAQPTVRGPIFQSGPMLLAPGEIIDFVIQPQLFNSTAAIRPGSEP